MVRRDAAALDVGANAVRLYEARNRLYVVDLASQVTTPTLAAHARDDLAVPVEEGRLLASLIPGARFVTLEDWANDGVPLAGPVARECLIGWYVLNRPARGEWRIAGEPVDPGAVTVPTLVVVPERDRIVPPASAGALAEAIPGARRMTPPAGHVGMVVGVGAESALWRPLAEWLTGIE